MMPDPLEQKKILQESAGQLAAWFRKNGRPLPWRLMKTPYAVLVSEIMLQQTRIEAVTGRYEAFMAKWPSLRALAEASSDEVLKAWEGLGYYSRARHLHEAAKYCTEHYNGTLPADYEKLRALPGLGDYTAGALASIGFGLPASAVDGNVLRVLSRLFADERDVLDPAVKKAAGRLIGSILPETDPGVFNEALMELGETVCLPKGKPDCAACPLAGVCAAHREGREEELPVRIGRVTRSHEELTVLLYTCGGRAALIKRPDKGLLAGLYGFPTVPGLLTKEEAGMLADPDEILTDLGPAKHIFTHVEWRMQGWCISGSREREGLIYVTPEELRDSYALPSAFRTYRTAFLAEEEKKGISF